MARNAAMSPRFAQAEEDILFGRSGALRDRPLPSSGKLALQDFGCLTICAHMLKRILPLLCAPLLLAGCNATFTNLTPQQQVRSTNNLYTVEVALASRQQTMRWDSIKPQIMVGSELYMMRQTPLMTN